jgi:hypothetical protein
MAAALSRGTIVSVRYNPAIGIVLIVLGAVNAFLALWLLQASGSGGPALFTGPLIILLGILQLTRGYFEFDPRTATIAVKALVGPVARRFGGSNGGRLFVEGNRILCTLADGRTKKVPVYRFYARGDQWRAVVDHITQSTGRPA